MAGSSDLRRERQFNEYLSEGITAAKSGNYNLAQSLLNRAIMVNAMDARPYLWLSATTKDPQEQREYLEKAVAADPMNVAARRGLAMVTGKIDVSRLMPEGAALGPSQQETEAVAQGQAFQCPRCGGRMSFSVSKGLVTCEYCGFEQEMAPSEASGPVADLNEKVLDFVMPTTRGHCWAEAQHRLSCERCGALSILPPGQKTLQCAYCGSNQLVESSQDVELLDPQVIGLVKIDAAEAARRVRQWLGKGLFTPDTLVRAWQHVRLQPAYYSFWTFDGTVELNWSCEVAEGSGNSKHWTPRSGVEMRFFNDVLVSGVKALSEREQDSIEPFNLVDVEEFQPEYLAGWPAILYDRPLSEASLLGRQKVVKQMRSQLNDLVEIGYEKRNLKIGGGSWSGMTYKHILLPIWIGAYPFQGKDYQVLVNGQTGKVGGSKPRDKLTLVFAFLTTLMFAFLIVVIYWLISGREFPF